MTGDRVGLVIIGAQKAGTTALFDHLGDDPRLNLSQIKETHFFDDESVDWARPDYGRYHAHFDPAHPGPKVEATPIYIFWPQSLERLAAYNPAARLVLLLRDPIARAYSHWQMEFARGVEPLPFAKAIREGRRRLDGLAPHHPDRRVFTYVERGFYGAQVARLLALFPREQLLVARADELRRRPEAVLAGVYSLMDMAPPPAPAKPRTVHAAQDIDYGPGLSQDDRDLLAGIYKDDLALFARLTGVAF